MATRNIVPRTTEEGQIGTTAKKWLKGYFKELYMGSTPAKCSVEGHAHAQADVTNLVTALAGKASTAAATTSAAGLVELATDAEFDTGTDTERYASVKQIRQMRTGYKNLLINGNFGVWQRGTTFSVTNSPGAPMYTADSWYAFAYIEGSLIITNPTYNTMRIERTSSFDVYGGVGQQIEFMPDLSGATVTVSFEMRRVSGSGAPSVHIGSYAGINNNDVKTNPTNVVTLTPTLTDSFQRFSLSGTISEYANKECSISIAVGFSYTSTAVTVEIRNVQLEFGSCATPFERRPYGLELVLCQRYFQQFSVGSTQPLTSCRAVNSIGAGFFVPMLSMRAAPTVALSNLSVYFSSEQIPTGYQANATAATCYVYLTGLSGLTQSQSGAILGATGHTGEITLSAEL